MCCCNQNRSCGRCCGNSSNSGNGAGSALPSFLELAALSGNGTGSGSRWPVYVSFPAFLWEVPDNGGDNSSCGCGCCG